MHVSELNTKLRMVGSSADLERLADLLYSALGDYRRRFVCYDIVTGAPQSGRVFYQKNHPNTVTLPVPWSGLHTASELLLYREKEDGARYQGPTSPNQKKGWEIATFEDRNGDKAVLAWAVWI